MYKIWNAKYTISESNSNKGKVLIFICETPRKELINVMHIYALQSQILFARENL